MIGLVPSSVRLLNGYLFLLLLACNANACLGSGRLFDVRDFGAVADGETDAAVALSAAWGEACAWDGTPSVVIPKGTFRVGPVTLRGPCKGSMVVQVEGVVRAPADLGAFPDDWWVNFEDIYGLTVTGGGVFDGQGASAWQRGCSFPSCDRAPTSIRFQSIKNATIQGISTVDSKWFHMETSDSEHVNFRFVTIAAPGDSPNTDGIHISTSSHVTISDSVIATGDDCISVGPGSSNLVVANVSCGPGHGVSVGSLGKFPDERDVSNMVVSNCTLTNTDNGVRIKSWPSSYAMSAYDITFEDIVMKNVTNPIIIDQEYCPHDSCNKQSPSLVRISNINFWNIRGTSASEAAVTLICSKAVPCDNVDLRDIDLAPSQEGEETTSICSNVKGTSNGHMNPPSCV